MLYLSFSYFLLPSLSSILKVRKRKLGTSSTSSTDGVLNNVSPAVTMTNSFSANFNSKIINLDNANKSTGKLTAKLNFFAVKTESSRFLNVSFLEKTQIASLMA
jgi:hypothetical protein